MRELRDYQADLITKLRASLTSGHKRPMVQLPTGGGKGLIAAKIIAGALAKGKRVTFTVPTISLVDQTRRVLYEEGITETGVIQANHRDTDWSKPVQVASVQTLARRKFPDADLVIPDEAHVRAAVIEKWMAECPNVPFIGLSATPWSKGLGKHYDDLIRPTTTQELIDAGYLSKFRAFAPSHPDLKGVKIVAGDYHESQLGEVMSKTPLVADVVETWIRLGENRPTICFCVNRAHARHVHERFELAGVKSAYIDAETPMEERDFLGKKLKHGEISVIVNIATLILGVDWPFVSCVSYCRPTRSEMLLTQSLGRSLRITEEKKTAGTLILDHSDSILRLGFVTDIDVKHTELDDGKKKPKPTDREKALEKAKLPRECSSCSALRPPGLTPCPACGHVPSPPKKNVATINGTLHEITRGKGTGDTGPRNSVTMRGIQIPLGEFYGMLKWHGKQRGFRPGWCANQFREAVGVWPNAYRDVPELEPILPVAQWIKSRMIRYAKGRRNTGAVLKGPSAPEASKPEMDSATGNEAGAAPVPFFVPEEEMNPL